MKKKKVLGLGIILSLIVVFSFINSLIAEVGVLDCTKAVSTEEEKCDTWITATCVHEGGEVRGCWLICPEPDLLVYCKLMFP